jgi:prevent-host-death family protein
VTQHTSGREARKDFFNIVRRAYAGEPTVVTLGGIATAAVVGYSEFCKLEDKVKEEEPVYAANTSDLVALDHWLFEIGRLFAKLSQENTQLRAELEALRAELLKGAQS